ncbi:hypothetical protein ACN28E_04325 [Archangium lansingense]|uniref:hypothetical protein n=1 Tax=Archangium lansingense TaxID=2995310 RepID=UPI003B7B6AB7
MTSSLLTTAMTFDPAARDVAWVGTRQGSVARLSLSDSTLRWLPSLGAAIRCLAVCPEGRLLLAADASGAVAVRHAEEGTEVDAFKAPSEVRQAAILGARQYVTVDGWRRGFLWSPQTANGLVPAALCSDGKEPVSFDAFGTSKDGARLVLLSALKWMGWERAGNQVLSEHQPIDGMQLAHLEGLVGLSASGARFFIYWDDYQVFDTASGDLVSEGQRLTPATAAALSDDGSRLVLGTPEGELWVVNELGEPLVRRTVSKASITQVVMRPRGGRVGWVDEEGGFGVVDAGTGEEILDRAAGLALLASP